MMRVLRSFQACSVGPSERLLRGQPYRRGEHGFTLLELIVSISIFAMLAAMAYGGLNNVLIMRSRTDAQSERLVDLQRAFTFMGRDIIQAVNRPVRDEYGSEQPLPALVGNSFGDYLFEFTRTGWRNPANFPRSNLQRVAWSLKDETLIRSYWTALDRAQDTPLLKQKMLKGVKNISLRFLDRGNKWHDSWPDQTSGAANAPAEPLPMAIEITLEHEQFGDIVRLFALPG
ncbi:MAG: type II secretion system minor pseudopilin GspJ [Thiohalomonadales bacterium]